MRERVTHAIAATMVHRLLLVALLALSATTDAANAAGPAEVVVRSDPASATMDGGHVHRDVWITARHAEFEAGIGIMPCLQPSARTLQHDTAADGCSGSQHSRRLAYSWHAAWIPPAWSDGAPRMLVSAGASTPDRPNGRPATAIEFGVVREAGPLAVAAGYTRPLVGVEPPTVYASVGWRASSGGQIELYTEHGQGDRIAAGVYGMRYRLAAWNGARWNLSIDRVPSGPDRGSQAVLAYLVEF